MSQTNLKGVIEALLFSSSQPLLIDQIRQVIGNLETVAIRKIIEEIKEEYKNSHRGMSIVEVAGGFQMVTSEEYTDFLKKFHRQQHTDKLSIPALETLSIIAYRQPLSRIDIEQIRGVNIDGVLKNLLDKKLIRIVGRKDALGRPFLYGTSRQFLEYFGLRSLEELPKLEEFHELGESLSEREISDGLKRPAQQN